MPRILCGIVFVGKMVIKDARIDKGKNFDWGRTSAEYAKFRDIYPRSSIS